MHDLDRVLGVCRHFGVTALVCVNKYDLNEENAVQIERYCAGQGVEVAARIPFDNAVTEAVVQGIPVVAYTQNRVTGEIESLWQKVRRLLRDGE
jgi:MinD superfamily P-loop ATPase